MVELPLEIIQDIITVSLPEPSFDDNLRFDFLLPLCHIHSSLTPYVKRILFSHPIQRSGEAIMSFLDAIDRDDEITNSVKSLRLGNRGCDFAIGSVTNKALSIILSLCDKLEDVWASNLENLDLAVFCGAKGRSHLSYTALDS